MTEENNNILYGILKSNVNISQIRKFPYSIGRNSENDLIINHKSISNKHSQIQISNYEGEQILILIDLNSSNGTYLNNKKITKHILSTGDKIRLGKCNIEYTFELINKQNINDKENNVSNPDNVNNNTIIYPNGDIRDDSNNDKIKKISLTNFYFPCSTKKNHLNNDLNNNSTNDFGTSVNISNSDFLLYNKIKNELVPNWQILPFEELVNKIDYAIQINKQKMDVYEVLLTIQSQYNNEVTTFNYILKKYDDKLTSIFEEFKNIYNKNSVENINLEGGVNILTKQINELIKEKEEYIMKINELNNEIIRLNTEIKLKETNFSEDIFNSKINSQVNDVGSNFIIKNKIEELEEKIQKIEFDNNKKRKYLSTANSYVSGNDAQFNINKLNNDQDQEITKVSNKLNNIHDDKDKLKDNSDYKSKVNELDDGENNNKKIDINKINLFKDTESSRVAEIIRLKKQLVNDK